MKKTIWLMGPIGLAVIIRAIVSAIAQVKIQQLMDKLSRKLGTTLSFEGAEGMVKRLGESKT